MNGSRSTGARLGTVVTAALVCTAMVAAQAYSGGGPTASAAAKAVGITGTSTADYTFAPRKVKIRPGARVNWSWQSNSPHNVVFGQLGKESKTGAAGTYRLRFKRPGVFPYICSVHGFTGKVVVRAG